MKTSVFDQQHLPTLSVEEGYTAYAATYDEVKAEGLMDYPLLECIQTVVWEQLEAVADLACGTGRIGVWLKEHGVHLLDGVDLTEAMLEQARAKGVYRNLSLADLRQTPLNAHSYDLVSVGLAMTTSRSCCRSTRKRPGWCASGATWCCWAIIPFSSSVASQRSLSSAQACLSPLRATCIY